jgi:hypothetical protein
MGDPEYQFCESSVFLPTTMYALRLSVGAGLLSNLFKIDNKHTKSEDTCEDACAPQKHKEFERQTSFSGLLQDTVRTSVTKVVQLIFLQSLQVALTIDGKTSSLSITTEKTGDSPLQHGLVSCLPPYLPPGQGSTSGSTKKNLG